MATPAGMKEWLDEAAKALDELPNVFQGVGATGTKLRRCKGGGRDAMTKRGKELWDALTRLENQGDHLMTTIRMALHFAEEMIENPGVDTASDQLPPARNPPR